jgi:hypothetical protein
MAANNTGVKIGFSIVSILAPLCAAFSSAASSDSLDAEVKNRSALVESSHLAGVSADVLDSFFRSTKASYPSSMGSVEVAHSCLENVRGMLRQNEMGRDNLLLCLESYGANGMKERFFQELFEIRVSLSTINSNYSVGKSLTLYAWLLDMSREFIHQEERDATWYVRGAGFLKNVRHKRGYQFQNGDVVIGVGNSSISALISQVSAPQSRYSHAFLVKVDEDNGFTTLESLIETGVKEFPASDFDKSKYNLLTVLRLKPEVKNRDIAIQKAVQYAVEAAKRKAGYDAEMDLDSDDKIFCSELIVRGYMEGLGVALEAFLPFTSSVRSEQAFAFISKLGVVSQKFATPADLMNSDYLEVVAEYRPQDNLLRAWEIYALGNMFLGDIENGKILKNDVLYSSLSLPVILLQLLPSLLFEDARLIPKSMSREAFASVATMDKRVFTPAWKKTTANGLQGRKGIVEMSPWALISEYRKSLESARTRRFFSYPR